MNQYIGYIRVSTVKQGTKGVSLQEQRSGISHYADRNQLAVGTWLEEMESAAKQGRPVFSQAFKLLREGKARGIILHKLDRGARNLKDWVALAELADQGIEVHFVNENLDLQSRGGRLSADIQAVVSADYIRNLREETRKGFYGRLKQGLYPLPAPIGYLDHGQGKPKTIDPIMGPIARRAFEVYGNARYNLATLGEELYRLGLRNRVGGRVTKTGLSTLLNNPFYFGLMRIKRTNEFFPGIHEPLISKALFDRVQGVLRGKTNTRTQRHAFTFRRMLACTSCGYSLIGELQKGHVYYRCHSRQCNGISIREDIADACVQQFLQRLRFNAEEKQYFRARILKLNQSWSKDKDEELRSLTLRLAQIKDRLNRLTDAYLDHDLDKIMFDERKTQLLLDQKTVENTLSNARSKGGQPDKLTKFLELAENPSLSHGLGISEEQREMIKTLTSNRGVSGKKLELEPSLPFREVANRFKNTDCAPVRDIPRTWDRIIDNLNALNIRGELPDLSKIPGFERKHTGEEKSLKE
jgi:site-specific DNA recombinase